MKINNAMRLSALPLAFVVLAGCQPLFDEPDTGSIGAARLAASPATRSAQRTDDDGYPVLGAFPRSANRQLSDAEVGQLDRELGAAARSRRIGAGNDSSAVYASRLNEARAARQRQAARQESGGASASPAAAPERPEEVLRRIEATGSAD